MMTPRSPCLAALAVVGVFFSACDGQRAESGAQGEMELLSLIDAALRDTWLQRQAEESSDGPLLAAASIREVFRSPAQHESGARAVIADQQASADAKRVAVLLMQCLPIGGYVDFLRYTFENVREGRCPESVLSQAIFPGENWGFAVAENHQRKDVRELLVEIETSSVGGEAMRAQIESILGGHTAEYLKHLRETGAAVPAIGCMGPPGPRE
jgi:hypothetical protein